MITLLVLLIISMLVYVWKIIQWIRGSILFFTKPDSKHIKPVKDLGVKKWAYTIGGIEHLIIFASLLAATLIIY